MDKTLRTIHSHMRGLGLGALAHANWHANYYSPDNAWWNELSVLQAAHAAEILIKAKIAEEHPLLIFDQLPRSGAAGGPELTLEGLVANARSVQYSDLPDRLWAATGKRISALDRFNKFGRLRNTIQHFAVPSGVDAGEEAVRFIYEVIDPFINECWGLYAIDYNEDYEPYVYLITGLIRRGVFFLVSPEMLESLDHIEFEWPKGNKKYKIEMEHRIAAAKKEAGSSK